MTFLQVENIYKRLGHQPVLNGIQFSMPAKQKLAIVGETGSGKTTLLRIVGGMLSPDEGAVWFRGERVKRVPEEKLIPGHPGIAYLSQHFELPNAYRVEEILSYANVLPEADAVELFRICRIDHLLKRRTDQVSGGEKQRIALARVLIASPTLLLLDEPFSNMDMIHIQLLKTVIEEIIQRLGISCIMILHAPQDTLAWADQIIVMRGGRILEQGDPHTIYHQPGSEYCAALFGKYNALTAAQFNKLFCKTVDPEHRPMIRPSFITLDKPLPGKPVAGINRVRFTGLFYELEIEMGGISLTVVTLDGYHKGGDTVSVKLSEDYILHSLPADQAPA